MDKILKKIKLIRTYSILIPMERKDFVDLFRNNIDTGNNYIINMISEMFSSSDNKYVGEVNYNSFHFRKRKVIFSTNKNSSHVNGVFRQKGDNLYMELEIKAFGVIATSIYLSVILFLIYSIGYKLVGSPEPIWSIVSALSLQALLLFGVPFLVARNRIKRMHIEIKMDIYNWMLGCSLKF